MPTDNPKVSGYVPKAVYDRLIQFKDERGVSISQAVTVVLAEYFGVDHFVDQVSLGGVTLAQIDKLEQKLTDFIESVNHRFQKLEVVIESSGILSSLLMPQNNLPGQSSIGNQNGGLPNEISNNSGNETDLPIPEVNPVLSEDKVVALNELLSELPGEDVFSDVQVEQQDPASLLPSELQSKLPDKEDLNDLPIPGIQALSAKQLGKRLKADPSVINRYKLGKRQQSLADWSRSRDPDGVAWEYSESEKKYLPIKALSEPPISLQGGLLKASKVDAPT